MSAVLGIVLPLGALAALAVLLPRRIAPHLPATLPGVAAVMALSAAGLVLAGAALFGALYLAGAPGLGRIAAGHPVAVAAYLLRLGLLPAPLWAPILAFVCFGLAQKTEIRR